MVNKSDVLEFLNDLLNNKDYKDSLIKITSLDFYNSFLNNYKNILSNLKEDINFFKECDPACNSLEEIEICYPGYKAIKYHRIAHIFYQLDYKIIARIISEEAHFLTGIDIHPGASIGCPFFIDHGTGIVIGETSIVGNYVRMYQGVTLGALSLKKGASLKGVKRHPTIGNNVILYAGCSILGGEVRIGDNTVIGSNVILLKSIPDNCIVTLSEIDYKIIQK